MAPNFTMLKIDGSLRTACEACEELRAKAGGLTTKQLLALLAIRLVRYLYTRVFPLPPERD